MNKLYTSLKTGITMKQLAWYQIIADKEFGREYCFMDGLQREAVAHRFSDYINQNIIAAF